MLVHIIVLSNLGTLTSNPLVGIQQEVENLQSLSSSAFSDSFEGHFQVLTIITLVPTLMTALGTGFMTILGLIYNGLSHGNGIQTYTSDTILMIIMSIALIPIGLVIWLIGWLGIKLRKYYSQCIVHVFGK